MGWPSRSRETRLISSMGRAGLVPISWTSRGGEDGLDAFVGFGELHTGRAQEGVERGGRVEVGGEGGESLDREVGALHADPLVVGEQQAFEVHHGGGDRDPQECGEVGSGGELFEGEQLAPGASALPADAFGIAGEDERLHELGARDDGRAAAALEPALQAQFPDGLTHGHPRDAEALGQLPFGGHRGALAQGVQDG